MSPRTTIQAGPMHPSMSTPPPVCSELASFGMVTPAPQCILPAHQHHLPVHALRLYL